MSRTRRRTVTVVEPYLAEYRLAFFERLAPALDSRNIGLTVAYGAPTGSQARRGDSRNLPGGVPLSQYVVRLGGRELLWRPLRALARTSDALVLDQSLRHLEIYPALAHARMPGGPAVGLFGHGVTYGRRPGPLSRSAKTAVTRCADWFFAYTDAGARHVAATGFPRGRITVVRNTIDAAALTAARDRVTAARVDEFRRSHGLRQGRTALYIGGLDAPKRIPFLLDVAERTARLLPGFRLLVAGDGAERGLVQRAARPGGTVVYVGPVSRDAKAMLGAAAEVLLMAGAVGLAAVDSFALGTPLITGAHAAHGPEFGYLRDGQNALVVDGGADAYAAAVAGLLAHPRRLAQLRHACRADAARYTVESMADRFAAGAEGLLGVGQARRHAIL